MILRAKRPSRPPELDVLLPVMKRCGMEDLRHTRRRPLEEVLPLDAPRKPLNTVLGQWEECFELAYVDENNKRNFGYALRDLEPVVGRRKDEEGERCLL